MPREKISLSVEATPTGIRYKRMVKGKVFKSKVFPHESRENKREAWAAFDEWRESAKEESKKATPPDDLALLRDLLADRASSLKDYAELTGDPAQAASLRNILRNLPKATPWQLHQAAAALLNDDILDERVATARRLKAATDTELTAQVIGDEFVVAYRRKAESERGSWGRYGQIKIATELFVTWFGPSRSLENLTEKTIKDYVAYLEQLVIDGNQSRTTISAYQAVFQTFITAVAEDYPDSIKIPTNLRSKRLKIHGERKEPTTFNLEEVRLLLSAAVPRSKLFLLLMLNCAMYQGDIADLKAEEVDWTLGRIVRSRSKRKRQANSAGKSAPIKTNWLLWRETFKMLKQFGRREGIVLLTEDGGPLVAHTDSSRNDAVRSAYRRVVDKLKRRKRLPADWNKTLKQFRKTGANLLEKSTEHALFYEAYLNHSSVARRSYLTSGDAVPQFDAAIKWMGEQIGVE